MTIKIELPATHTVTKGPRDKAWLAEVTVDVAALSPDIVARLAVHGLHQKIADAASAAQTRDEALASMQKAADAILAGDWTQRTGGGGVDERTLVMRQIVKAAMKESVGAKSEAWATFTGQSDEYQNAKFAENYEANKDALDVAIEAKIAERKAERDRKAGLAKTVTISL